LSSTTLKELPEDPHRPSTVSLYYEEILSISSTYPFKTSNSLAEGLANLPLKDIVGMGFDRLILFDTWHQKVIKSDKLIIL